jgi:acetyl-CoA synthetase
MSTTTDTASVLPTYLPSAEFVKNAAIPSMDAYYALCKEAETDYEGYWARLAKELISWKVPFTQVLDESNAPFFKWFADGKLNASYNCLDRNVEKGLGDKTPSFLKPTVAKSPKSITKTCWPRHARWPMA